MQRRNVIGTAAIDRNSRLVLLCGLTFLLAQPAAADILSTTGAMTEIAAPASFADGVLESSTEIVILDEGTTVLPGDVVVNAFGPGVHTGSIASTTIIPGGTWVHSYIVHFDPDGGVVTLTGDVFFDPGETIVGIQTHSPLLDFTDAIAGGPPPIYPTGTLTRGFETLPGTDTVTIAPGLASASFTLIAELGIDEARIFTVPEPSSLALSVIAAIGITYWLRRRAA